MSESPIRASAEAHANFEHSQRTIVNVTDVKNYPPRTNKIETVGKVRKKTYNIVCDGQGKMMFYKLGGKSMEYHEILGAMRELKQTFDMSIITASEYEELRKQLLDQLGKVF